MSSSFVRAFHVLGIIVRGNVERQIVAGAGRLVVLPASGRLCASHLRTSVSGEPGQTHPSKAGRSNPWAAACGTWLSRHRSRLRSLRHLQWRPQDGRLCGRVRGLGLHKQEGKRLLHGHGPPVFHREAIPEMILIGHGLQQVDAGLMLQGEGCVPAPPRCEQVRPCGGLLRFCA